MVNGILVWNQKARLGPCLAVSYDIRIQTHSSIHHSTWTWYHGVLGPRQKTGDTGQTSPYPHGAFIHLSFDRCCTLTSSLTTFWNSLACSSVCLSHFCFLCVEGRFQDGPQWSPRPGTQALCEGLSVSVGWLSDTLPANSKGGGMLPPVLGYKNCDFHLPHGLSPWPSHLAHFEEASHHDGEANRARN